MYTVMGVLWFRLGDKVLVACGGCRRPP